MHYVFFFHLSVDGHLGYFHIFITVNNIAMNTRVYVSFKLLLFFSPRKTVLWFCSFSNSSELYWREMLFIRGSLRNLTNNLRGSKRLPDLFKDSIPLAKSTQIWWAVFRRLHRLRVASEAEGEDASDYMLLLWVWLAADSLWIIPQWTHRKIYYA